MAATADRRKEYKSPEDLPAILTVADISSYLGININKGYSIARKNNLKTIKIGRAIRITRAEFLRWLNEQAS